MKAGTTPFFILALGYVCAAPAADVDASKLDFGTCPTGYEEIIKPQFKSGLVTAYAGEPLIWPPRQYWYKAPFSKLLAGYLVPVTVEQTRGTGQFQGHQLYGFLFRNGELVKKLNPMQMQLLDIGDGVGPIPRDERDWQMGHSASDRDQLVQEFVPPGETVQNWTELVTLQTIPNPPPDLTPARLAEVLAEQSRKSCMNVTQDVISETRTDVLFERTTTNCAPVRDEYSILKVMQSFRSYYFVTYAKTSPLSEAEREKWIRLVGAAELLNECKPPSNQSGETQALQQFE